MSPARLIDLFSRVRDGVRMQLALERVEPFGLALIDELLLLAGVDVPLDRVQRRLRGSDGFAAQHQRAKAAVIQPSLLSRRDPWRGSE